MTFYEILSLVAFTLSVVLFSLVANLASRLAKEHPDPGERGSEIFLVVLGFGYGLVCLALFIVFNLRALLKVLS